ncbi:uncharacterized protein A4U43_C05F19400 [Asparagus officinalis]|uniref:Uncharacterized protein n=1 Tax=Asparagus officinalis TaxID=4686 RepID=A0A5P1ETH2_ASPOF|nr:uncharacterized protein A4U43_C05F19400 [Asparagus officinalis]
MYARFCHYAAYLKSHRGGGVQQQRGAHTAPPSPPRASTRTLSPHGTDGHRSPPLFRFSTLQRLAATASSALSDLSRLTTPRLLRLLPSASTRPHRLSRQTGLRVATRFVPRCVCSDMLNVASSKRFTTRLADDKQSEISDSSLITPGRRSLSEMANVSRCVVGACGGGE